jgi:hypothetical protein
MVFDPNQIFNILINRIKSTDCPDNAEVVGVFFSGEIKGVFTGGKADDRV